MCEDTASAYDCGFAQGFSDAARTLHVPCLRPPLHLYLSARIGCASCGRLDGYIDGWIAMMTRADACRTSMSLSRVVMD